MIDYLQTKNPYFNASGLTSSEANYVCERIKERLKPIQDLVNTIETHTSSIDGEPLDNFEKVDDIGEKLTEIGSLYAISAYLRTAIKEKENRLDVLIKKLTNVQIEVEKEVEPIDYEQLNRLKEVTIEDYLKTLSLEDVVRYKEAEAKAAHIGKYIHNFDEVRTNLTRKELITLKQVGEQVFKIKNVPLYDLAELQELQEQLLAQHREVESEVNFYKTQFRTFQNNAQLQYEQELQRLQQERQEKVTALVVERTAELMKIKETVAGFRIVVPNSYKSTIEYLLKK
ncbi:hypothetical protein HMPREF1977_0678 [Capnocytophaga ochracea F0287]|uniref:Uncharacterized protein n=1 Tax=Capnocytophaga ochracea F0287 TaxID=873517 RepID=E4MQL8_CAPOC|nr:hypothetical protein [Capnocytophaga ochracea]EFS98002.1 hypothetical protein HMPREF1977_0678 [Capnocytophaga ochracea F0287]EJF45068.1 hypothetical protein HMPREF1319_0499 [Capnocytophaga ochracea str. Holt 25]UEB43694.1 hypothetical protein LK419_01580 [Capnocytophaga ochracea]